MTFTLRPIQFQEQLHIDAIAGIWTGACGEALAGSSRLAAHNAKPTARAVQNGSFAWQDDEPVGFVMVSVLVGEPTVAPSGSGWINGIAVLPDAQRTGIGSALLEWAEAWLIDQGCETALLGGSLRPFAPGVPTELDSTTFFLQHGYTHTQTVWDVAANLAYYESPDSVRKIDVALSPARPGEEAPLMEFLQREFPGRWRYEFSQFLREEKRMSDYMLLWTERGIDGFCRLTFEDSQQPIERFYPYQLARPWGQLGPIGVSADRRGMGYGSALLDAGLRRLHDNGINGCVIDWTGITEFYAKFGFEIHRAYNQLSKVLI